MPKTVMAGHHFMQQRIGVKKKCVNSSQTMELISVLGIRQ